MAEEIIRTINRFKTVNDVYLKIYFDYGFIDKDNANKFFGIKSSDDGINLANIKMNKIVNKFLMSYENRRLKSIRGRIKRNYILSSTSDNSITNQSIIDLLKRQNFHCAICNCYLTYDKKRHLDHIIPLSKGGKHILSNVQWTCQHCNLVKHNKIYANNN